MREKKRNESKENYKQYKKEEEAKEKRAAWLRKEEQRKRYRTSDKAKEKRREQKQRARDRIKLDPVSYYKNLSNHALNKKGTTICSEIDFIGWWEEQDKECFYCDHSIQRGVSLGSLTIDRINSGEGYELSNMVFCCRRCNLVKGNWFSVKEMVAIAQEYLADKDY